MRVGEDRGESSDLPEPEVILPDWVTQPSGDRALSFEGETGPDGAREDETREDETREDKTKTGWQWKGALWRLALSVLFHGAVLGLLLVLTRIAADRTAPSEAPPITWIPVELVEAALPAEPLPETAPETEPETVPETEPVAPQPPVQTEAPIEEAVPPARLHAPPSLKRQKADDGAMPPLARVLEAARCPRFIDPADHTLAERCARLRAPDSLGSPLASEAGRARSAAVAARIAAEREKEALRFGWVAPTIELTDEQRIIEAESQMDAPAADVFGPWPWEKP